MKTTQTIILVIVILLIGVFVFTRVDTKKTTDITPPPPVSQQTDSIEGCYAVHASNDVYTLSVLSQMGENFSGTLAFKNFQKDSSSGTFIGTYKDGILLGDYTFQSEGTTSVMQVIFKKSGDTFIRGYGDVNAQGTRFVDVNSVSYEVTPLSVFNSETCTAPTPLPTQGS